MIALLDKRLDSATAEAVRRSHADAIKEQQALPIASMRVIRDVVIPGTSVANAVPISHGLGRAPLWVGISAPRVRPADIPSLTAGMIIDLGVTTRAGNPIDRSRLIYIGAFGFTVNVIVDVVVF